MPVNKLDIEALLNKYQASYNQFLNYAGSRMTQFKVPRKYHEQFLDTNGNFEPIRAYNPLAHIMIMALETEAKILRVQGVVERIHNKDLEYLTIAIFEGIIYLINNDLIYERVIGNSISTPNFSFSTDSPRYILSSDFFGMLSKQAITNSEIKDYELFETHQAFQMYQLNNNGIIQFIANDKTIGGQ